MDDGDEGDKGGIGSKERNNWRNKAQPGCSVFSKSAAT